MRHRGLVTTLLRAPVWLRAFLVASIAIYLGLIGYFSVSATAGSRVILAVFALGGAGLVYRLLRLGVAGDAEHLVVRNQLRTLTYARADVEQFRTGKPVGPVSGVVLPLHLRHHHQRRPRLPRRHHPAHRACPVEAEDA